MRNTLLKRCLISLCWLCLLVFASNGQEYQLEQDLTGYKSVLGELFYGSEESNIDYYLKTENNLWLYSMESGELRVLDSANVEIGREKLKFRYEKTGSGTRLKDRLNFFIIGRDSIALELNRDTKKSIVAYFSVSDHTLKKDKVGLGQKILFSRTYPLKGGGFIQAKEVFPNDFYFISKALNTKADTLFTSIKSTNTGIYGQNPNIVLQKVTATDYYLLDKFARTLYQYNSDNKKLEILMSRSDLREVFAWTKSFLIFDVQMLFDEAQKQLYFLSKKVINGKRKSVLYSWTGSDFKEVEVPNYTPELDRYFNVQQIFDGHVYFTKFGYLEATNKYIHSIKLY